MMLKRCQHDLWESRKTIGGCIGLGILATVALVPVEGMGKTGSGAGYLSWFSDGNSRALRQIHRGTKTRIAGAREFLLGKEIRKLRLEEVVELVRTRNLNLAQQKYLVDSADQAIVQADSSFDTSLSLSLGVTHSTTRERKEIITRLRQTAGSWKYAVGDAILDANGIETGRFVEEGSDLIGTIKPESDLCQAFRTGRITIDGTEMSNAVCTSAIAVTTEDEFASGNQLYFSDNWTGSLGLFRGFGWGQTLSLGLSTNYIPYDYEEGGLGRPGSKDKVIGLGATAMDLGESEWTSSASANFSTPLPFSKNFGEYGTIQSVNLLKAEISKNQAEINEASQVNVTVQMALNAYWDLILSLLQVESAIEHRSVLAAQKRYAQKMYDLKRFTEYSLMQARTEVENARNEEEITWNSFIIQGNRLAEMLDLPADTVIFPVGFSSRLGDRMSIDAEASIANAMQNHPQIRSQNYSVDLSEVELKHRQKQLLPNLSLNFSYNIKEENAIYGYKSFGESMEGLADPDSRNYTVTLNLSYPLGNNDVQARYAQARAAREQSLDSLHLTRLNVTRSVNDAISNSYSNGNQLALAGANLKLARSSFRIARSQWENDKVSSFDMLRRERDLFEARTAYITALIAQRKSHVDLLAAEGKLVSYQVGDQTVAGVKQ